MYFPKQGTARQTYDPASQFFALHGVGKGDIARHQPSNIKETRARAQKNIQAAMHPE